MRPQVVLLLLGLTACALGQQLSWKCTTPVTVATDGSLSSPATVKTFGAAGCQSNEAVSSGGMVGVSITPTGPTTLMFGLEDAPADFTDLYPPVRLTYGLQLRADGTLVVMEANRAVSNTLIFYSAGDVLSVRFDAAAGTAGAVEYAIGDLVFFTTAAASFGNAPKKAGLILANGAGLASGAYALLGAPVCTNAGNCSTLFRRPCFDADTCGSCMPGRSGDPCVTNEAAVGSLATWALLRGATDASGVITPHAESTWGNSGMVSAEGIVAGGAATGIEFGTDSTTGSVMVGLTRALSVSGYASYFALDFAFYLRADSLVGIYESGSSIFTGSELYTVNDKFTIRLATQGSKTVVQYAVNGIVVYTSAKAPVFPLMAGVSFGSRTAKVKSIRWDAAGSCSAAPASCGSLNRGPCFDDDLCAPCFAAFRATDNTETSKPAVSTCNLQTAAAGAITWRRESHITRTATPSIKANAGAFWGRTGMVSDEGFIPGQSSTATGVSFKPLRADRALMVGISQQQTYPDLSYTRISYAVYLRSDGMLGVYESGRSVYFMNVPYAANQEIVIRVSGSAVEYAIEGQVFYTSLTALSTSVPMVAVVSFATEGAEITEPVWTGLFDCSSAPPTFCAGKQREACWSNNVCGPCIAGTQEDSMGDCVVVEPQPNQPVTWTRTRSVNVTASGLRGTANGWGASGAVSREAMTNKSGGFTFTIPSGDKTLMVGLNNNPKLFDYAHFGDLDFSIYFQSNGLITYYEKGVRRGFYLQTYKAGDVFTVRYNAENGRIEYATNEHHVIFTSTATPVFPLTAGVSFGSVGAEIADGTWLAEFSCANAPDCTSAHRFPCYSDDTCSDCRFGYKEASGACVVDGAVAGDFINWAGKHGVMNGATGTNSITSIGGGWGMSGAVSSQSIDETSNTASGFSFQLTPASDTFMVGLTRADDAHISDYALFSRFQSAIYFSGGFVSLWELGVQKYNVRQDFSANDEIIVRVNKATNKVEFAQNKRVFFQTVGNASFPLVASVSFGRTGASINNPRWIGSWTCNVPSKCSTLNREPCFELDMCGACFNGFEHADAQGNSACTPVLAVEETLVTWARTRGTNITGSTITSLPGTGWGSAGAVSSSAFIDGHTAIGVSFTAPNVKGWYMVGINRGTEDETWAQVHDFTRLEHSIYVRGDGDQFGMATFGIFETGVQVHYVQQWYKAGDRFTIRANSETKKIEYALNGRVMYTSLKTVIFPFTAGVSMQTAGSSVQDVTWEGQYDCSTATAAFCASKNRLSCFNNNECGDCLHGFEASSSNANSMCNLSPAEAKSTVQWELFRGVTFPDSSSIAAKSWTTWGTSGAISTHAIGDCSAASGVSLTSAFVDKQLMFGLAFNPTPEGYAHYNNIQYAFYLRSDGGLHVYENGLSIYFVNDRYTTSDVLGVRLNLESGLVEYTKNQQVLYVSKLKPKTPLNAVISFASAGAQVSNVKWTSAFSCASAGSGSGNCHALGREPCFHEDTCGPCRFGLKDTNPAGGASNEASCVIHAATADAAVTWDEMRGIKVNGTNLSPVGAVGWGYSGAVSQHSFADCDESGGVAGIRFKAGSPDGYAMIGLNHAADINNYAHYADLDFSVYLQKGTVAVYEKGRQVFFDFPGYEPGDSFVLFVGSSGKMQYAHNGEVLYVSAQQVQLPLTAGISLYTGSVEAVEWQGVNDCSLAGPLQNGDCSKWFRHECFADNKCGECRPGFSGPAGAQEACTPNEVTDLSNPAIVWRDYTNVFFPTANTITSRPTVGTWGQSGAVSDHALQQCDDVASGVEVTLTQLRMAAMFGLAHGPGARDYAHYASLNFALYIYGSGTGATSLTVYEKGSAIFTAPRSLAVNDRIGVRVNTESQKIEYYLNEAVFYTSTKAAVFPLTAGVSFAWGTLSLANVDWAKPVTCKAAGAGDGNCAALHRLPCFNDNRCGPCRYGFEPVSGGDANTACVPTPPTSELITWAAVRAVDTTTEFTVTSQGADWNTGAVSAQVLEDCAAMGGIQFSATAVPGAVMVGLNHAPHADNFGRYTDMNYAIYMNTDRSLNIFEASTHRFAMPAGTISAGDKFALRVNPYTGQVEAATKASWTNNLWSIFYTSATPVQWPLAAGISFATRNISVTGLKWTAKMDCDTATPAYCRALGRTPCFDNDVCGPCFLGLTAADDTSACTPNAPTAGSFVSSGFTRAATTDANKVITGGPAASWGTSGLVSSEAIVPCGDVAGVEFTAVTTNKALMVGLAAGINTLRPSTSYTSIHFALYLGSDSKVQIYEIVNGVSQNRATLGLYAPGHTFQVLRNGDTGRIEYLQNGRVIYVSAINTTVQPVPEPLVAAVSFGQPAAAIKDLKWVGATTCSAAGFGDNNCGRLNRRPCTSGNQNKCGACTIGFVSASNEEIGNTNDCNVFQPTSATHFAFITSGATNAPENELVSAATTNSWNAGAVSSTAFDGCSSVSGVSFSVNLIGSVMVGLSNAPKTPAGTNQYTDIDYALYLTNTAKVQVYESGSYKWAAASAFNYSTAMAFAVRVNPTSGKVEYVVNNAVVYTSAVPVKYPLSAAASFQTASMKATLQWEQNLQPAVTGCVAPTTVTDPGQPQTRWCSASYTAPLDAYKAYPSAPSYSQGSYCDSDKWSATQAVWAADVITAACANFSPAASLTSPWPNTYQAVADRCNATSIANIWSQTAAANTSSCFGILQATIGVQWGDVSGRQAEWKELIAGALSSYTVVSVALLPGDTLTTQVIVTYLSNPDLQDAAVNCQVCFNGPENVMEGRAHCLSVGQAVCSVPCDCAAGKYDSCIPRLAPRSSTCNCKAVWQGSTCQDDFQECQTNTHGCAYGCVEQIGAAPLCCSIGYQLSADQASCVDVNECLVAGSCATTGSSNCTNTVGSYTCTCKTGWTGGRCEVDIDECTLNTHRCAEEATCTNTNGSFSCSCALHTNCSCPTGYQMYGPTSSLKFQCAQVNECTLSDTDARADVCGKVYKSTCIDTPGSYQCQCSTGFTGDPYVLCYPLSCEFNTECNKRGTYSCVNSTTAPCRCNSGYGNRTCEPLAVCDRAYCSNRGECSLTADGDALTCTCDAGYGGPRCASLLNKCAPNPCFNAGSCKANSSVTDGYVCTCPRGWTGSRCEIDVDGYCDTLFTNSVCRTAGTLPRSQGGCLEKIGYGITCVCKPGYTGTACQISPCNSTGTVTGGYTYTFSPFDFTCICKAGYSGKTCNVLAIKTKSVAAQIAHSTGAQAGLAIGVVALVVIALVLMTVVRRRRAAARQGAASLVETHSADMTSFSNPLYDEFGRTIGFAGLQAPDVRAVNSELYSEPELVEYVYQPDAYVEVASPLPAGTPVSDSLYDWAVEERDLISLSQKTSPVPLTEEFDGPSFN